MEGREAAVADAGPLIHLDELGALRLLDTYTTVWVPTPVAEEADRHRAGWRERGPDGVRIVEPSAKVLAAVRNRVGRGLHPGEVAAPRRPSRVPVPLSGPRTNNPGGLSTSRAGPGLPRPDC